MYDFCIIITSYNREAMLKLLLDEIFIQQNGYKILIIVFDDGSLKQYDLSNYDVKYIRYYKNHGKRRYWEVVNDSFKYIKNINSKYNIYLPDDVSIVDGFFESAIKLFNNISEKNKLLTLLLTQQRKLQKCWTNFEAVEFRR